MSGIIVHEWLEPNGGAEKVVEELAAIFPAEQIIALWNDAPTRFANDRVLETWLARTPLRNHKSLAIPFMLHAWRTLEYQEIDWVLCSSHLFAHHAKFKQPNSDLRKYVYAYTPARYIWNPELDQRGDNRLYRSLSKPLRVIDRHRAREATSIAAISKYVQRRVEQHWEQACEVIYPPVDVEFFERERLEELNSRELDQLEKLPDSYLLGASRFIPYKQLDQVIRTGEVTGLPVILAGGGPEEAYLRAIAAESTVPVTFVTSPSRAMLRELYSKALAYVFPAVEDFGIMPLEAMATGTPVIAGRVGGTAETVAHGSSGSLIDFSSGVEAREAVEFAQSSSRLACLEQAKKFDSSVFRSSIRHWVDS